ncbi:unnamed protein product [Mytilus edulis]|uniref:Uncharacterized protein n=1 Tax=Mytilus edulis TaxID=6550 RepID=A0A8S3S005_MYTED|nr:unnamed protein product [Mytilus edulis]
MLLLQRCNIQSLQAVGLRRIEELSCVKEHTRAIAKVNAYVQAFLKVRSICTLHELKYCLRECDPEKTDFNNLNLGPMQRLPIIYEYFKFPTDMEEIPAITTVDILEHLRNYLTQNMKWSEKVDLTQFMEYLVPQYEADNAYQLGIRISSVALAIQILRANASALFHLAICVSHSVLQEAAMKRLLPKEEEEKTMGGEEKNRKNCKECKFPSFVEISYGDFYTPTLQETKEPMGMHPESDQKQKEDSLDKHKYTPEQLMERALGLENDNEFKRNFKTDSDLWEDGIVPYTIVGNLSKYT